VGIFAVREGTLADFALQQAKRAAFRWPVVREFSRPRYPYNITPGQLAWLCDAIDATRKCSDGCIVEVGCARGMTTLFLLEHMRNAGDNRQYICIDTFEGFVRSDVEYEVEHRGKRTRDFRGFGYNDAAIFEANIRKCGHTNVKFVKSDVSLFSWENIPPIDVMLLDVDLYQPTKTALSASFSRWSKSARVMLDDCQPGTIYDGASVAYQEFCFERGFAPTIVGSKGGVIGLPA
jgi:O-methyltransferase